MAFYLCISLSLSKFGVKQTAQKMNTESKSNGTGGASRSECEGQFDSPWRALRQIDKSSMRLPHGSVQNILISRLNCGPRWSRILSTKPICG